MHAREDARRAVRDAGGQAVRRAREMFGDDLTGMYAHLLGRLQGRIEMADTLQDVRDYSEGMHHELRREWT